MIDDIALYVWGSYAMGLALVVTEMVLLRFRDKAIRGHLGWIHGHRRPVTEPNAANGLSFPDGNT